MKYIPIHKKTEVRYPAITEQQRQNEWGRPPYSTHFYFEPVSEPDAPAPKPASEPTEAKKAKAEPNPAND